MVVWEPRMQDPQNDGPIGMSGNHRNQRDASQRGWSHSSRVMTVRPRMFAVAVAPEEAGKQGKQRDEKRKKKTHRFAMPPSMWHERAS